MNASLTPSLIQFSADIASDIGIEQAVLLQFLVDISRLQPSQHGDWSLSANLLTRQFPFWSLNDLQRVIENLRQRQYILVLSSPICESKKLHFSLVTPHSSHSVNNQHEQENTAHSHPSVHGTNQAFSPPDNIRANRISPQWRPDNNCWLLIKQQGIAKSFAEAEIAEFVHYWHERGVARHAWDNQFLRHLNKRWLEHQAKQAKTAEINNNTLEAKSHDKGYWQPTSDRATSIPNDWRPSIDAMDILQHQAGIATHFIEDAIAEFILYWTERGHKHSTWNTKFIQHVRRQWAEYQHATENDSVPKPLTANWQPRDEVFEVLKLAHIDRQFANEQLHAFVIYWQDRGEARPSWNTVFLQYVKRCWREHNQTALTVTPSGQHVGQSIAKNPTTRQRSLADDLNDRSWAN